MEPAARARAIGFLMLAVPVLGWGFNWPAMKLILAELPPMSARAAAGFAAAALLAAGAALAGVPLAVPRRLWGRLVLAALLNVSAWMGSVTLGLLWLDASEGVIVAYTMPVWTALAAWPVLGERPTPRRLAALGLGLGGLVLLAGGLAPEAAKLPGIALILLGAIGFSLGTVLAKRAPLPLPPLAAVAWQVGIGALPMLGLALLTERPDFAAASVPVWLALGYMTVGPLALAYLFWFLALRRLPAGAATLGTLATPVVGVLSAAAVLGEALGPRTLAALGLTLAGILLALSRPGR